MKAIVAISDNRGIGNKGDLPWPKISEDFKWFKEFTLGKDILVGRKTNLPPLKKRIVYILSQSLKPCTLTYSSEQGIDRVIHYINDTKHIPDTIIACGGAEIYKQFLPQCDELFITHVKGEYEADTFFPFTMEEIRTIFPHQEQIKEFEGGHKVIKYAK